MADETFFEETQTEVRYGETDQMGYAHHSVAVLWFEMGRVFWLRHHGLSYREQEASGVLLPVVEMNIKYHAPGRFEDQIVIQTRLIDLQKTRITFESRVLRVDHAVPPLPGVESRPLRTLLVSGSVDLACLDKGGRIRRVPDEFNVIWKKVRPREL